MRKRATPELEKIVAISAVFFFFELDVLGAQEILFAEFLIATAFVIDI